MKVEKTIAQLLKEAKPREFEDQWWYRFLELYSSHFSLEKKNREPNLIVMDTASCDMLQEKLDKYNARKQFEHCEIVIIPRCGKSEVHFFRRLK